MGNAVLVRVTTANAVGYVLSHLGDLMSNGASVWLRRAHRIGSVRPPACYFWA